MTDGPRVTYMEDEYHFAWDAVDIEVIVERIREERGVLKADFQPQSISGTGFLPSQAIDLVSGESAKRYANVLGSRLLDGDTWFDIITLAQRLTRDRYRSGDPSIVIAEMEWRGRPRFLVDPFIEAGGTAILFGDGGVSKSIHALTLAISVATGTALIPGTEVNVKGPVLYLDWETEPETQAERMEAICAGAEIARPKDVVYMRRTGSIGDSAREIRREIARLGAVLVVVDSVGAACGGDPERADQIIRTFDGMRTLAVPVLAIHHIAKDAKDKTKPFGSVYAPNLARLVWRLDRQQAAGAASVYVTATNYKANNGAISQPQGHRVSFSSADDGRLSEVLFESTGSGFRPAAATERGNGIRNAIGTTLLGGDLTVEEIARDITASADTVRRTLNRHKDWFTHTEQGKWGLLSGRDTVPGQAGTVSRDNGTKTPPLIGGLSQREKEKEGGSPF